MIQASHSAMSIDIHHRSKQGCCTNQTNIFIQTKTIQPTMRTYFCKFASHARARSSFAQPQSRCLLLFYCTTTTSEKVAFNCENVLSNLSNICTYIKSYHPMYIQRDSISRPVTSDFFYAIRDDTAMTTPPRLLV
jgi:hypothetical protein